MDSASKRRGSRASASARSNKRSRNQGSSSAVRQRAQGAVSPWSTAQRVAPTVHALIAGDRRLGWPVFFRALGGAAVTVWTVATYCRDVYGVSYATNASFVGREIFRAPWDPRTDVELLTERQVRAAVQRLGKLGLIKHPDPDRKHAKRIWLGSYDQTLVTLPSEVFSALVRKSLHGGNRDKGRSLSVMTLGYETPKGPTRRERGLIATKHSSDLSEVLDTEIVDSRPAAGASRHKGFKLMRQGTWGGPDVAPPGSPLTAWLPKKTETILDMAQRLCNCKFTQEQIEFYEINDPYPLMSAKRPRFMPESSWDPVITRWINNGNTWFLEFLKNAGTFSVSASMYVYYSDSVAYSQLLRDCFSQVIDRCSGLSFESIVQTDRYFLENRLLVHPRQSAGLWQAKQPVIVDEAHGSLYLVPPRISVAPGITVSVPPPKIMGSWSDERVVHHLARAYRSVSVLKYPKKQYFKRFKELQDPDVRRYMLRAARELQERNISPAIWVDWSCEVWAALLGSKKGSSPKAEKDLEAALSRGESYSSSGASAPGVKWVYSPSRIASSAGWFARECSNSDLRPLSYDCKFHRISGMWRSSMSLIAYGLAVLYHLKVIPKADYTTFCYPGGSEAWLLNAGDIVRRNLRILHELAESGEYVWKMRSMY